MHLELGSVLCRAEDIDVHSINVCWAAELLYIRSFAKFGRGSGDWGWKLNQVLILPCKIFCFPGLIPCLSLTPNLQPGHNDRLNEIHFEDVPSWSTSQSLLFNFSWEKIERVFHPLFLFSSSPCLSSSFIKQIFTKHILLWSDGGRSYF